MLGKPCATRTQRIKPTKLIASKAPIPVDSYGPASRCWSVSSTMTFFQIFEGGPIHESSREEHCRQCWGEVMRTRYSRDTHHVTEPELKPDWPIGPSAEPAGTTDSGRQRTSSQYHTQSGRAHVGLRQSFVKTYRSIPSTYLQLRKLLTRVFKVRKVVLRRTRPRPEARPIRYGRRRGLMLITL